MVDKLEWRGGISLIILIWEGVDGERCLNRWVDKEEEWEEMISRCLVEWSEEEEDDEIAFSIVSKPSLTTTPIEESSSESLNLSTNRGMKWLKMVGWEERMSVQKYTNMREDENKNEMKNEIEI